MNLDIGCGKAKQPGFVGLDMDPESGADIIHDLRKGIPLGDNEVDLLIASHILEHLPNTLFIMKEIHRVCKNNAQVAISVPHYQSQGAWGDPTHVRAFSEIAFHYFDKDHPLYSIYNHGATFKIEHLKWSINANIEAVLTCVKEEKKDGDTERKTLRKECRTEDDEYAELPNAKR